MKQNRKRLHGAGAYARPDEVAGAFKAHGCEVEALCARYPIADYLDG